MDLLATTNRGVEAAAEAEIERLTGASVRTHHPGWVAFESDSDAVALLNARSRTLHRVLVSLVDDPIDGLDDAGRLTEAIPTERYVRSDQSFGVRSTRIGSHAFGSPDVAEVVGQAIIDAHREATGDRLAVDLDDPDVVFRSTVRHDRFTLALDTTGPRSLHRRPFRVCDHPAPIRPTLAAAMLELADYGPGETLVDPMCGGGTIPIEAALAARGRSPNAAREDFAFRQLRFVPDDELDRVRAAHTPREAGPAVVGAEVDPEWVACARQNVDAADVPIELLRADATAGVPAADVVAVDLPFNLRSNHGDLRGLYGSFVEAVEAAGCDRLVALTTRPDLLPVEPEQSLTFRDAGIDVSIVVARF